MATATYTPIATTTLGSAQANIDFTSIPATYTDLRITLVGTGTVNNNDIYFRVNSDTTTNYSVTALYGDGTSAASAIYTSTSTPRFSAPNNYISSTIPKFYVADLFNYAGSTFKTALFNSAGDLNGATYSTVANCVWLWRSTSAITAINLSLSAGNFAAGTTATLYGILKA